MRKHRTLNESRSRNWKNSDDLSLVRTSDGRIVIESGDRFYDYSEMSEAVRDAFGKDIRKASAMDIRKVIEEDLVDSEGMILDEVRYDWRKIDPLTGMPKIKEPDPEESIELMNRMPGRSGWIVVLQNRVNLGSVGNVRFARKVWFDRASGTVSDDANMENPVHFRSYVLPGAGRPGGWMALSDYEKLTHRKF